MRTARRSFAPSINPASGSALLRAATRRHPAVGAFLVLALVACGKERPDPRLAEVTSPLHVTVRVIDAPVERSCAGSTLEQLGCLLGRADREGCIYVELGEAADSPQRAKQPDAKRCSLLEFGMSMDRTLLQSRPGRKATLFVEPGGERIVVDLVESVHAIYLRKGHLRVHRKLWDAGPTRPAALLRPDGTLNWSLIPPFLAVLDAVDVNGLTQAELDALLAGTPGGKAALKESLLAQASTANWMGEGLGRALSKLPPEDRVEIREAILAGVVQGQDPALEWFLERPEEQTGDFIDAIEEGLRSESLEQTRGLPVLLQLAPARAEKFACEQVEKKWHENTQGFVDSYGYMAPDPAPLAVIVARKVKCPWVVPLLQRNPCTPELQCDPDAEDQKPTPLCTPEQSAAALSLALDAGAETEGDEWGALLLAAALVQGPLPPAVKLANDRRLYALTWTFTGDEEGDPCRALTEEPVDWACRLPVTITTSTTEGCRLVLDDAKKTMTLSPVP